MKPWITSTIAVVVTLVWAVSFIGDLLIEAYEPSPYIHLAMMAIVGAAFGTQFIRNRANGNGVKK